MYITSTAKALKPLRTFKSLPDGTVFRTVLSNGEEIGGAGCQDYWIKVFNASHFDVIINGVRLRDGCGGTFFSEARVVEYDHELIIRAEKV